MLCCLGVSFQTFRAWPFISGVTTTLESLQGLAFIFSSLYGINGPSPALLNLPGGTPYNGLHPRGGAPLVRGTFFKLLVYRTGTGNSLVIFSIWKVLLLKCFERLALWLYHFNLLNATLKEQEDRFSDESWYENGKWEGKRQDLGKSSCYKGRLEPPCILYNTQNFVELPPTPHPPNTHNFHPPLGGSTPKNTGKVYSFS